jgi:hypothetical protein
MNRRKKVPQTPSVSAQVPKLLFGHGLPLGGDVTKQPPMYGSRTFFLGLFAP